MKHIRDPKKMNMYRADLDELTRSDLIEGEREIYDQLLPKLVEINTENSLRLAVYAWISYDLKKARQDKSLLGFLKSAGKDKDMNRLRINYLERCLIFVGSGLGFCEPSCIDFAELITDCEYDWPSYWQFIDPGWE